MKERSWRLALWLVSLYMFARTGYYMVSIGGNPILAASLAGVAAIIMYLSLFYNNKEEEKKRETPYKS